MKIFNFTSVGGGGGAVVSPGHFTAIVYGLTEPIGWLSLLQLNRHKSVHNRCVIEVFVPFLNCHVAFCIFLWV